MTLTNNIVAKLAVAFVAVAMAFTLAAPAQAQNVSNMSLEQLIALVNQLQSQLSGSTSTGSCAYTFTRSLGQGSTGADVMNLQKFLNMSADTQVAAAGVAGGPGAETSYYGPATAAAVSKFQTKYSADILVPSGLTSPTGYFGPASMAKANSLCAQTGGGNTGGGTTTGPLRGGAGDLTITARTANTENSVGEGATENVVSFEAEADDNSDIAVTSIRVALNVQPDGSASSRANRYVDEVLVFMEDDEVGSADISDFSRSGSVHTATINLSNAIVRSGESARFYIALVARDSISSDDHKNGATKIEVSVDRVRFEDATGAILTESGFNPAVENEVSFTAASADNSFSVQSSSNTPAASILKVEPTSTSDEFHVLTFRLKTGSKSADVDVTRIVVDINTIVGTSTATATINDIWLKVGNTTYRDYTLSATSAIFDIDEGDLVIDGDDTETVEVYAKFNRVNGNYNSGSVVRFVVVGNKIVAEDVRGNSVGTISGTATGKDMTLSTTAASVGGFNWSVGTAGTLLDFLFTVEAEDDDFTVLKSEINITATGTATTTAGVLSIASGDATTVNAGTEYTVAAGDTATFRVRFPVNGANGSYLDAIATSVVGQQVPNDKQNSPTVTRNVQ